MKKRIAALFLAASVGLSMAGCSSKTADATATTQAGSSVAETTTSETKAGAMKAGTYSAKATGMHELTVEVVVTEDKIELVTVKEHQETPGISDLAIQSIPENIVKAQGLGIDAVSGATISSTAILTAAEDCLKQAGADVEALKAIGLASEEKAEDMEKTADVIVVGAGGAGLAAAVTAHQNGASVIILEKMPKVGGNTILAGGALNAVDEGSETAIANDDSVEKHYTQTWEGGDKQGDPQLVRTLVDNAWGGVEWLKSLGMEFKDGVFTVTGGMWPRAHKPVDPVGTGFFNVYTKYINDNENIEIMLDTKADTILTDDSGRVTGVVATGKTGNQVTLHANNGVIVATGGFGKNVELREKYNKQWPTLGDAVKSTNHEGATGDAVVMLESLNANFVQMENIQLLPLGDPETGSLSGNIEHDVERRIFINKEGNRFVNEGGRRDDMTKALFEQTDNYMWIVMDSDCYPTGDEVNNFNESVNDLISQGRAVKGETLEELAKNMGVPAENLAAAVEAFNKHAETKETDEFGRTLYSTPIDTAPYYAAPRVPTVHHTMGGVQINTDAQVLDTVGAVIPGLYAAGEVTGGIHGANRLGGNALTDTVVFGRIAGASAAEGK